MRDLFIFYFGIVAARIFYLQIVEGAKFQTRGELQREGTVLIPASRGEIFSRDGFPLSENKIGYVLNFDKNLDTKFNKNYSKIIPSLVDILAVDKQVFSPLKAEESEKLNQRKKVITKYINGLFGNNKIKAGVIYKKLTDKSRQAIEKLNFASLFFTTENLRKYPESSMSAHVLGFLGRNENDNQKGFYGLEGYYDLELKGIDGYRIYEKDPLGRPILLNIYEKKDSINGRNITTSLDRGAQKIVEKWLHWGIKKYQAKSGSAILYDPARGEVMAMANEPNFDPNNYYLFRDEFKKNSSISDEYEPGSIMKPLVAAAAINEKLITPQTKCPKCAGPRALSGYTVRTFDDQYLPSLTMQQVLERSDNTGMTYIGELLGKEKILKYFKKLGFGEKTNIDLEGEVQGFVKKPENIYEIDQATMTFGQGISVTSIQMVKAYSALIMGKTSAPHLAIIFTGDDKKDVVEPIFNENVYSDKTAQVIKEMLTNVVEKSPLHFARDTFTPQLKNYEIAAKSGTAQIAIGGKYEKTKTIGSVIGFAPANDPKFILFVKLDEPQADPWGANTAGPIFFNILNDLFIYYNIPPSK